MDASLALAQDVAPAIGATRRERDAAAAAVALLGEWPELEPLSHLLCELAIAEVDGLNPVFSPMLIVAAQASRTTPGYACEWCCHWDAPLRYRAVEPPVAMKSGFVEPFHVGLFYEQWIVYDYHICRHQRLDRGVA